MVPAAGFRNPKQHFSNFGPPLGASHFFQLPGSGTTPWRHPGKVAIFPWCSVCEVSARVFFTGRGWVHRLLFPYKKQNPHGPRLENLTVFDTVFFRVSPFNVLSFAVSGSTTLPLACPCPCLGLSQRQALCCLCHTQTHTILLFLVSHAFSRTHTVPWSVTETEALPTTRPGKTFSPQESQNLQSSLKAVKSVQKHEAFLQDTKKKFQKKVKKPIPEFVFSHREAAMIAISCLSLLLSTFGCFTFGFFWACLLFAPELGLSWAPLVFSSGFQTLNDNLVGFQNPKWFFHRVFKP